jgi:hypothetical protein
MRVPNCSTTSYNASLDQLHSRCLHSAGAALLGKSVCRRRASSLSQRVSVRPLPPSPVDEKRIRQHCREARRHSGLAAYPPSEMIVLGGIIGALLAMAIVIIPVEWIDPTVFSDFVETVIAVVLAASGAFAGSQVARRIVRR